MWPARVFAPYLNVWANTESTMNKLLTNAGVLRFTIAFIVADSQGNPAFDGSIPLSQNFLKTQLATLKARGGEFIYSFGGAGGKSYV